MFAIACSMLACQRENASASSRRWLSFWSASSSTVQQRLSISVAATVSVSSTSTWSSRRSEVRAAIAGSTGPRPAATASIHPIMARSRGSVNAAAISPSPLSARTSSLESPASSATAEWVCTQ